MNGVRRVVAFNWPRYVAAAVVIAVGASALAITGGWMRIAAIAAAGIAAWFACASVVATWWAYDASDLKVGRWLARAAGAAPPRVAIVHAGLDLASAAVMARWPACETTIIDIYDPALMPERSIARAHAGGQARTCAAARLPVADGAVDAVLAALALHELRSRDRIAAIAREAMRVAAPNGRLVVVEHLRDARNALVYGPGVGHFLPERLWLAALSDAGWAVADRWRLGVWLTVFALRRA